MSRSADYEELDQLTGSTVPSEADPRVTYRLERCIGAGGIGVVFLALRVAPAGMTPVVIKVVRPSVVAHRGPAAIASIRKEAVALGRLNEHVPPTPFVVRLLDAGETPFTSGLARLALPWLAIELVHGGEEGTTLEQRVGYSVDRTGYAFEPARAARALRCLVAGIGAIHSVGVLHRDLTPGNVLCCSFGEAEIFKISDFGLSRSAGMEETFGRVMLGTPGYAAPEQSFPEETGVGPYSDVFSLACAMYFALTGDGYFDAATIAQAFVAARAPARKRLLDAPHLCPELRERPDVCESIDAALARATAYEPRQRPHLQQMGALVLPLLTDELGGGVSQRLVASIAARSSPAHISEWSWTVRHPSGDERVIHSADWDGDASCLAATTRGLEFWDGMRWLTAPVADLPLPHGVRFVHRVQPGCWLVGGGDGTLAMYTFEGVQEIVRCPNKSARFTACSGRLDDLLVAAAERPGYAPELWAMAAKRWLKPLPVPELAGITSMSRLEDSRWLIAGRTRAGCGFAAHYSPLDWEISPLQVPPTRALVAADAAQDRGLGLVAGSAGQVVVVERGSVHHSQVPDGVDLSAAAVDVFDRRWVASLGRLWMSESALVQAWACIWKDMTWSAPFVRLMPDAGRLVALAADGGVVEGRARWRTRGAS